MKQTHIFLIIKKNIYKEIFNINYEKKQKSISFAIPGSNPLSLEFEPHRENSVLTIIKFLLNLHRKKLTRNLQNVNLKTPTPYPIKESLFINSIWSFLALGKISLIIILLNKSNEDCKGFLKIWLLSMFFSDILNLFALLLIIYQTIKFGSHFLNTTITNDFIEANPFRNFDLTYHREIRRRLGNENTVNGFDLNYSIENSHEFLKSILFIYRFCYLIIFLLGNTIFFSENEGIEGFLFFL